MPPRRALVTGAAGFVGRHAVAHLKSCGWTVRTCLRRPQALPEACRGDEEIFTGDLADRIDWRPHLAGIDAVVHLAARGGSGKSRGTAAWAVHRQVNRDATLTLATAAAEAGVQRFLFMSSLKACDAAASGQRDPVGALVTAAHPDPVAGGPGRGDAYAGSKAEAEQVLGQLAERTGLSLVVLRPPLVYGPGVSGNFRLLLRLADSPWPLPFAGIANRRSLIYVGNLTAAVACALERTQPSGTYALSDGQDLSTGALLAELRRHLGRPGRQFSLPAAMLRAAAHLVHQGEAGKRLFGSLTCDGQAFQRAFSWHPPFTTRQGLATTVAWYRERHRTEA